MSKQGKNHHEADCLHSLINGQPVEYPDYRAYFLISMGMAALTERR